MRTVLIDSHDALVGHAKSVFESAGIPCSIRNELPHVYQGGSIVGPMKLFDPELAIVNDTGYRRAIELLRETLQPGPTGIDWNCPACGETVPGSFAECWACQTVALNFN